MSRLLSILASYVPIPVIRHLRQRKAPVEEPFRHTFPASVLFADISGFTKLTESLAKKGSAGEEELTRHLNLYFGQMIDIIDSEGGEVVKFAGDALLALWPVNKTEYGQEDLIEAARRATQCAMRVQDAIRDFRPESGVVLALRISIGIGEMAGIYLGGVFRRWEFLITGQPLSQVGKAGCFTNPGELVVSGETWNFVSKYCAGSEVSEGCVKVREVSGRLPPLPAVPPAIPEELSDSLRGYIPAAIRARLDAGQSAWIGELRRVTVLFANLPDLRHDTPLPLAQKAMEALQTAVYTYEGSINKLSIDDKGITLVAALGLPPLAHEDDPARGVQAACALQKNINSLGWKSAIGVTSGRVFCGSIGNEIRREYTVIGDLVNLSARLMQAAKGGILCDRATWLGARYHVPMIALPPIKVKGKTDLIEVFRPDTEETSPVSQTRIPSEQRRLIGRDRQMNQLREGLQVLDNGKSRTITIEGEAGIGKSRLIKELLGIAKEEGRKFLFGSGDSIHRGTPYFPWRKVLSQVLKETSENVTDETFLPLLNAILPGTFPENEVTESLSRELRVTRIQDQFVQVIKRWAGGPCILVLDDLQSFDSASWQMLRSIWNEIHPALFVLVHRPIADPIPDVLQQISSDSGSIRIRLSELGLPEIQALAASNLGSTLVSEELATFIFQKAQGHPFFSQELTFALRDHDLIEIENGKADFVPTAKDLSVVSFPDTVHGIVASRIDRLTPGQQLALKVGSVIGMVMPWKVINDIYPISDDRKFLQEHFEFLRKAELTMEDAPPPDLQYSFRNNLTQEVAYSLMLFSQRQGLHRAVANWYEKVDGSADSPFCDLLAHHWVQAGEKSKAIPWLARSGEKAVKTGAYREALLCYERLFSFLSETKVTVSAEELSDIYYQRIFAQYCLGQSAEARKTGQLALELLGEKIPCTTSGLVLGLLRETFIQAGHFFRWRKLLEIKRDEKEAKRLVRVGSILDLLSGIAYLNREELLSQFTATRLLNLAERAGVQGTGLAAAGYGIMGWIAGAIGISPLAWRYIERAEYILERSSDPVVIGTTLLLLGMPALERLAFDKAEKWLGECMEISRREGLIRHWQEAAASIVLLHICRGEWAKAKEVQLELERISRRQGDVQSLARSLGYSSWLALHRGEFEAARRLGEESEANHKRTENQNGVLFTLGVLLNANANLGNFDSARVYAEKIEELLGTGRPSSAEPLFSAESLAMWSLENFEKNPTNESASVVWRRIKLLKYYAGFQPVGETWSLICQGWYLFLNSSSGAARNLFCQAIGIAGKRGLRFDEAVAGYHLARLDPGEADVNGISRRKHLTRAIDAFEKLGAVAHLKKATEALKRLDTSPGFK